MDETELIGSLQSHLESALSHPVKTSGLDDERPVPVVIIDDWNTNDFNFHNSAFAGESLPGPDSEYERYLNFDFQTRVEFLCRHSDEVEVSRLKSNVKRELRLIGNDPLRFHEDCKNCIPGGGGNPTYQFTEPKEAEEIVSARFHGDHTITLTPSDTQTDILQTITENFELSS